MTGTSQVPPVDDGMLAAVTKRMVAYHERYYGRKPGSAQSQLMGDDMIACVLGNMYTDVEKTLIELQRQPLVHDSRTAFQQAMGHRFIAAVEEITGREVEKFISTHNVGPDLELELFVLGPATQA